MRANQDIRDSAKKCNVRLWEIADKLGLSEAWFCRKMRKELPEDEKLKIFSIIGEISDIREGAEASGE